MIDSDIISPDIFYWRGSERFVFPKFVNFLFRHNLIVNPIEGGLVLGPSHDDGGIQIIREHNGEYIWMGEMEGYEYLVSSFGTTEYDQELEKINTSEYPNVFLFEEYDVPENISIIDCRPVLVEEETFTKWIGLTKYSQRIVNKAATQTHLSRLNKINHNSLNNIPDFKGFLYKSWWQALIKKSST